MKLSVVVPCYNEAANVSEFESELSKDTQRMFQIESLRLGQ